MGIKAIIFDLDGVIINTEPLHYGAYKKAFETVGYVLTQDMYNLKLRSRGRSEGILSVVGEASEEIVRKICDEKDKYFTHSISTEPIELFDDAVRLMNYCKSHHILMGIGTASKYGKLIINKLGLENDFEVIITSQDVLSSKPDPEIYNLCREKLGVASDEVLVVEDSESGVIASLRADLKVVYIKRQDAPMLAKEYIEDPRVCYCEDLNDVIV